LSGQGGCRYFRLDKVPISSLKLTIMSTKFAVIGIVSVLGTGAVMHHARFCPLQKMMAAMHHPNNPSVVAKVQTPSPATAELAKKAGTVALR
jgi:hypothetical protein